MYDDLTTAAIQAGTDKFGLHDYTPNYHKLFKAMRDDPVRILEIGVGGYADGDRGGQSLAVWRDYFPKAQVVGIDIQEKCLDLGPRVTVLQGSQVDADFLADVVKNHGPFDIIVDDGSHRNEHIVESYQLLFPTLAPGGIYVAEDVQTSFHPRFGGSLEMTAPNAVGHFGQIARDLTQHSDIAAMERFHNMIALHKAKDAAAIDLFDTPLFAPFAQTPPAVRAIGPMPALPFVTKPATDTIDLLILTADETTKPADIETHFSTLADNGVMVIHTQTISADLAQYIQHRFTMVDHVEIVVHHPDAPIDALAGQIYGLERYKDAIVLHKAPNRYPSNFAFDAQNPQAAAAVAHMGAVLQDSDQTGGLVHYASILARYISVQASAEPIHKLTALGATSREYFQMAGALARAEKRMDDARMLFATALDHFPNDPQFSVMLAAIYANQRQPDRAEITLRAANTVYPRARNVVAALSRTLEAKGSISEAKVLVESTINLFPQNMRPARLDILQRLEQTLDSHSRPM